MKKRFGLKLLALLLVAAALLGWGGVSVHCQTAAVLEDTGLSLKRYLLAKALQAVVSALFALGLCCFSL